MSNVCRSDVKCGGGLYVQACVSVSAFNGEAAAAPSIKTRCEWCFLPPGSLGGGPSEATCTGSYSTRRAGMLTTGCPGSSPRIPEASKGKGKLKTASYTK